MSYLLQNKKRTQNQSKKILVLVIVALCIGYFGKSLLIKGFVALNHGVNAVVSFVVPSSFRTSEEIKQENIFLRNEVTRLQADVSDRQVLFEENVNLKSILGRKVSATTTGKSVLATVIERPTSTPNDTFILDVGLEAGIKYGDKVIFGNLIIGTVIEAGSGYSKAGLFSSPGNVFEGVLVKDNTKIQAKGLGGGQFEVSVPLGSDASVGDTFILPSISPKVFGVVQKVEELRTEGFKILLFTLPVNPNQIGHVVVIH